MGDRQKFLLGSILSNLGPFEDGGKSFESDILSDSALSSFLDDPNAQLLVAYTCKDEKDQVKIRLSNTLEKQTSDKLRMIHLVKKGKEPVSTDIANTNVMVISDLNSPIFSLYTALHQVWAPQLLGEVNGVMDQKTLRALSELEKGLKRSIVQGGYNGSLTSEDNISGIGSISSEIQYWENIVNRGGDAGDRASTFVTHLTTLSDEFTNLTEKTPEAVLAVVESSQDALNDLFTDDMVDKKYPQARMSNLLDIMCTMLQRYVSDQILQLNVWNDPYAKVKQSLSSCIQICEQIQIVVMELHEHYWRDQWEGKRYSNDRMTALIDRFTEIRTIRSIVNELYHLLSSSEQEQFNLSSLFSSFDGVDVLQVGSFSSNSWNKAVDEYNKSLKRVETFAATSLKSRIFALSDRPQLLVSEFRTFPQLLQRQVISDQLETERESLLGQLLTHVEDIRARFEQQGNEYNSRVSLPHALNLSVTVNSIIWAKQLEAKVTQTSEIVQKILSGVNGVDKFTQVASEIASRIKEYAKGKYQEWEENLLDGLANKDADLMLEKTGRLMELDTSNEGLLKIHYSERLVVLLREVRQLSELGFKVPREISSAVDNAQKYYRYALQLKQVANFYNTMGEQIIRSQSGLLLRQAAAFETVVKERKGMVWDDPDQVEKYMTRLMTAAEALTSRNRKLRTLHLAIAQKINNLMSIDILRKAEEWKAELDSIESIFTKEERAGSIDRVIVWRRHWDEQLFKAFEIQYRLSLLSLNETKTEIPVDLVFSNKKLAYRPALEDLRTKYYRNMRKYLDSPNKFKGFCDGKIYRIIPERNANGLLTVYKNAEGLFRKLDQVLLKYSPWVILGYVQDLEVFVETHLSEVDEWLVNFKALKSRRKELSRLPDKEKVGMFCISFAPFKSSIEDQLHRLSDALMLSLKRSATTDLKKYDDFIKSSLDALNTRPHNVEEMGLAKQRWKQISIEKVDYERLMRRIGEKNTLLKQMVSVSIDIGHLKSDWEQFLVAFEAFDEMLNDQKEQMMNDVEKRIKETKVNIDKFASRWSALKPNVDEKSADTLTSKMANKIVSEIEDWETELSSVTIQKDEILRDCDHFEMPQPDFKALDEVFKDISDHKESWGLYRVFSEDLELMTKEDWFSFRARIFDFEDFLNKWTKNLKGRARDVVFRYISTLLKDYKDIWPYLRKVTGELFEKEHWKILFNMLKIPKEIKLSELSMGHFLNCATLMKQKSKDIDALAARAQGEVNIRDAMEELKVWCEKTEFELLEHKTGTGVDTALIKGWKDLFTQISDQTALIGAMKDYVYFEPFKDAALSIESKLNLLENSLASLNQIQRKWMYLEPIFSRGALPNEQARFQRIDEDFRMIMEDVRANPNVIHMASIPNLEETVTVLLDQLERCQRALNDFLEEKRGKFPRFYFIGDDDLLEILGQAQNPEVIENHLKKLFAGIHSVDFSDDKKKIIAMKSSAKEVVPLKEPVVITEDVEIWLQNLSVEMENTLTHLLIECVKQADLEKYPSQILCLAEHIHFARKCEYALMNGGTSALEAFVVDMKKQLDSLVTIDTEDRLMQKKISALVLDLIHNIAVVDELLIPHKVTKVSDWLWQKQLRTYLTNDGFCVLKMCDAEFKYSYEYQGNAGKLVHTPLTDKCYLVLTQGMHLGYGGNPYGPAGTGKTESVKALGNALGRQVLVFNCDEGIDFQSMGRIFTGLVKSGAWGCFDEFNRLKEDQLSAVSQQIQVIQAAIKNRDTHCELMNRQINVNLNAGIFVTMNPASKEYGGRSKLPHNLKQLFRAVAMTVPDLGLISEVMLYSEGFQYAKIIGAKVVYVFRLCKQLLTPQRHYDWGLRALKTVLTHGGNLVRKEKRLAKERNEQVAMETEMKLLIGAMKINTLSKLTYDDGLRYQKILEDVFPGVDADAIDYNVLEEAIRKALVEMKLEIQENQILKILQLYQSLAQRMGCVVVGPSGCGKTTMLNVLHRAMAILGKKIERHVMNPKAIDREKLLGQMDPDTREWFDGVLTAAARQVMLVEEGVHSWIICDGDVDPEWIESLNSVLDDNHLLTMPNGERIRFGDNVNFVFESHDLQHASPATVSRMGMIFLSESDIDLKPLVHSWVQKQTATAETDGKTESKTMKKTSVSATVLTQWMDDYFYRSLEYTLALHANPNLNEFIVQSTKVGVVNTALSQLEGSNSKDEFVINLIRGMGSSLPLKERAEFALEVFSWAHIRPPNIREPLNATFSKKSIIQFQHIETKIKSSNVSHRAPPMIETVDIQRNQAIIRVWLKQMAPFIVVGPEGAGKTLLLVNTFAELKVPVATVHCNAQTKPQHVIAKLMTACTLFNTNKGRVYRPKGSSERVVLYLKDLNLPAPDEYDTIQLIAFLQQLITYGGFYDDNLEFIHVENVQIVGSMCPGTTVGRHALSTRFTAIVHILVIDYPSIDQLKLVYSAILKTVLKLSNKHIGKISEKTWKSLDNVTKLCDTFLSVYQKVKTKFPIDQHRHYLVNPRDVTEWVFGLLRYNFNQVALLDAFYNEAMRLFRDRLVGQESVHRFESLIQQVMRGDWSYDAKIFDEQCFTTLDVMDEANNELVDDNVQVLKDIGKLLRPISLQDYKTVIAESLHSYEREFKELNILLFPEILDHIASVERVLTRPGGSMLLVGDSGVGRRTATTLVCHMMRIQMKTINLSQKYNKLSFANDIKEILRIVGIEGKKVCLYLEDHQFVFPSFLEDVNGLLSSGEIPGLFQPQERDSLIQPIKELYQSEGVGICDNVWDFFLHRVRHNLHIVMSMNNHHPLFAIRTESNPALYTQCEINWMGHWSKQGMTSVPSSLLEEIFTKQFVDEEEDEQRRKQNTFLSQVEYIHNSCNELGATPYKYIIFLNTYIKLFHSSLTSQNEKRNHLAGGLKKLKEAAGEVDRLSADAKEKASKVSHKQQEADKALIEITEAMTIVNVKKKEADQLQEGLSEMESKLKARQKTIEAQLKDVQPMLDAAAAAVDGISKSNLNEVRSLRLPPPAVRDVVEGVMILMGLNDKSWKAMQKFLGSPALKNDILGYDAHRITPTIRDEANKCVQEHKDSFIEENAKRASIAAAPLASWVKANLKYAEVLVTVAPLEAEFKKSNAALSENQSRLKETIEEVTRLDNEVQELKASFSKTTQEAAQLRVELTNTEEILNKAQSLLGKLSGEEERWSHQVQQLDKSLISLPLSALMAAGFITYLGQAPEDIRRKQLAGWCAKCDLPEYDFRGFISTESEFLTYKGQGLPSDNLSFENALVIDNSLQCPFIIDPNSQASKWLATHLDSESPEGGTMLQVQQQEHKFANTLENAIRFGKKIVVTECDGVPAFLYPILRNDLLIQGPRKVVVIGDRQVDYNAEFRMFLVTRDPAPDLSADAVALINIVNFTVTRSGLEDQLLGVVISHENPGLEKQKSEMLAKEEKLKVQQDTLERTLLEELAASEGNILENETLLVSLNKTKSQSLEIATTLDESHRAQEKLNTEREVYRKVAHVGSILFFLIRQLSSVNNMYEFALPVFVRLFNMNLDITNDKKDNAEEHIKVLCRSLTNIIYIYCARSIFKDDRLMFAMHVIHCLHSSAFAKNEWEFFTGELANASTSNDIKVSKPSWVPTERIKSFNLFASTFTELNRKLNFNDDKLWQNWMLSPRCELDFPPLSIKISSFQQLLCIKTFRPDRLQSAMEVYACKALRLKDLNPDPLNFRTLYESETSNNEPILFVTTAGADPSVELEDFAIEIVGKGRFKQLAMGGGNTNEALEMLKQAAKSGGWICLKNLHLVTPFLFKLEKALKSMTLHKDFRLWLTTEPHPSFPPILSQSSLKITYESPPGIKQNLLRTYESWGPEYVNKGSPIRAQMFFILAWFHAIVQERRNFVPQGWTKFYEFSFADLRSGAAIIDSLCQKMVESKTGEDPAQVPWTTIWGLMKFAIYGGRIDDDHDVRVLTTYLKKFFHPRMLKKGDTDKSSKLSHGIEMPYAADYDGYMRVINSLSTTDSPSRFGLPPNIEGAVQQIKSSNVLNQLKKLAVAGSLSSKFNKQIWGQILGPLLNAWNKIRQANNKEVLRSLDSTTEEKNDNDNTTPIEGFVKLELSSVTSLVLLIDDSIMDLYQVVFGNGMITPVILNDAQALLKGELPWRWQKHWYGPEDPLLWVTELAQRKIKLQTTWYNGVTKKTLLDNPLQLGDLFQPRTFLNALRQQTARQTKTPIDSLKLVVTWNTTLLPKDQSPVRVTVKGLLLQGASFEGNQMQPLKPEAPQLMEIPQCTLACIPSSMRDPYETDETMKLPVTKRHSLALPVYVSNTREEFVTEILVPCTDEKESWILNGCALFLNDYQ